MIVMVINMMDFINICAIIQVDVIACTDTDTDGGTGAVIVQDSGTDSCTDSFKGSYSDSSKDCYIESSEHSMCFLVVAWAEWLFVSACLRLLGMGGCLCSFVAAWIEWLF